MGKEIAKKTTQVVFRLGTNPYKIQILPIVVVIQDAEKPTKQTIIFSLHMSNFDITIVLFIYGATI